VSILNRLSGHLDDRALAAIWTDASIDRAQPVHPHLDSCALCRTRLAAFASWLDDLRTDANAEADEAFPPERLAVQKAQILRRIEAAGRSARVIKFPRFAQPISASSSQGRRWVAAAAACLIVGFGLGQFMDLRHSVVTRVPVSTSAQAGAARSDTGVALQNASLSDEELMSRIEEIAEPRMPASLVAFDSMTPRVQDYPQ
jgi:predicted anti-sigma-YlaC factor YlaD